MKKQIVIMMSAMAILFSLTMLFTRCEADPAGMSQLDALNLQTNDRGTPTMSADLCACLNGLYPAGKVSAYEKDALIFMREEEKLARDVYKAMEAKWNVQVFSNISKAEQRHMDAIGCLLDRYNIPDPVGQKPAGVFQNDQLQQLYNTLVAQGNQSKKDALLVGATIEDLDIADLMQRMEKVDNTDIKAVFGELMKGSRNHLRAFVRNLENNGITYTPQNIKPDIFNQIINSPKETGNSICGIGPGNGQGQGNGNCNGQGNGNGPGNGNCPNPGNCNGQGNGNGPGNGTCPGNGNGPGNGPGNGNGNGGGN
jgi:hypothetical protein